MAQPQAKPEEEQHKFAFTVYREIKNVNETIVEGERMEQGNDLQLLKQRIPIVLKEILVERPLRTGETLRVTAYVLDDSIPEPILGLFDDVVMDISAP